MRKVIFDCSKVTDWNSFHSYSKELFGFPDFYGRNMNAWIDCLTYLDDEDGMSLIKVEKGSLLVITLENVVPLKQLNKEIYEALIECSAFINYRRIDMGDDPVIVLSFWN